MKNLKFFLPFLLTIVGLVGFTSCGNDDDKIVDDKDSWLVGAWTTDINPLVLEFTTEHKWNAYTNLGDYKNGDAESIGCGYKWFESTNKLILYSRDQIKIMEGICTYDYEPELVLVKKDRNTIIWHYSDFTNKEWDITWTRVK